MTRGLIEFLSQSEGYSQNTQNVATRSPVLPTHRSYCLLLLSHVDIDEDDLREQAVEYDHEDEIDALLRYLVGVAYIIVVHFHPG